MYKRQVSNLILGLINNAINYLEDCGFTKERNWFRYRAAAIIIENDCVLFAGNEIDDYYYSIGGGVHMLSLIHI